MPITTTAHANAERRAFGIHPGIILTLMREQAGSLDKALSELVMNAVDAGASRIDITIDQEGFSVADNGHGFTSRDQLENFFEIFGTPHEDGDAYYGRFRIGRGQIMSYASTNWRSGPFEMRVDIAGASEELGYDLITHAETTEGCHIQGKFYEPKNIRLSRFVDDEDMWSCSGDFLHMVKYVPIPVWVNGQQINTPPSEQNWDMEDEMAWYRFDKDWHQLSFHNCGVHVENQDAAWFGTGGIVVTKKPLKVNLARNSIIRHQCDVWKHVHDALRDRFSLRLDKVKKLCGSEASRLFHSLLFEDPHLDWDMIKKIRRIRFIPDIFGELRSPDDFFANPCYTLYDGRHTMVAERVQRQGKASVLHPDMFNLARIEQTEENLERAITSLRKKLYFPDGLKWIPFDHFVRDLSDTHRIIEDADLPREALLVLNILRQINDDAARMFGGGRQNRRRLIAGEADKLLAWTDGISYISIHVGQLTGIRGEGGPTRLIGLLAHEYCHTDHSVGEHRHDLSFYQRFHNCALQREYGWLIDKLLRKYVSALGKEAIVPSSAIGYHVKQLVDLSKNLVTRKTRSSKLKEA